MGLEAGARLGGYRIVEPIARGGMGTVWLAVDDALGRKVAIKVLAPEVARDREALARFRREAETIGALRDPNVAVVHGAHVDGDTPFLVLEHLPGGTLFDRIRTSGRLPWRDAAAIGAKLARGLAAVHSAGLVHRDVKPGNVLFDERGEPRLGDFGLARITGAPATSLTRTGELVGTPEYASPEQMRADGSAGPPADLYALGATLFAAIAGRPPFAGNVIELARKHLLDAPPALSSEAAVPRELDALVARLLAKEPARRGTASKVAAELDAIARATEPTRAPPLKLLAAAGSVVVMIAAAGFWAATRPEPPPVVPPPVEPPKPPVDPTPVVTKHPVVETPSPLPRRSRPFDASFARSERGLLERFALRGDWILKHGEEIQTLAVSSQDPRLALSGGRDCATRLWNVETGEELWSRIEPNDHAVIAVAFAPGARVVTLSDRDPRALRVLELDTGEVVSDKRIEHQVKVAAFSRRGDRLLMGGDGGLELWDALRLEPIAKFDQDNAVYGVGFSPDGSSALVAHAEGELAWFRLGSTPELVRTIRSGTHFDARSTVVAFSQDGTKAAVGTSRSRLVMVDPRAGRTWTIAPREDSTRMITSLAFSADGMRLVSGDSENDVRVWDLARSKEIAIGYHQRNTVRGVQFLAGDERILTGGDDAVLRILRVKAGKLVLDMPPTQGHRGSVNGIAFLPNGRIITGGRDRSIRSWPADLSGQDTTIAEQGATVSGVAVTPDGSRVISAGHDDEVNVWDSTGDSSAAGIVGRIERGWASVVVASGGSRVVAGSRRSEHHLGEVVFFDREAMTKLDSPEGERAHDDWVHGLSATPDGTRVASGGGSTVKLWDPLTGALLGECAARPGVRSVAILPDGGSALVGSVDGWLGLCDLRERRVVKYFMDGHKRVIDAIALLPDAKRAFTASEDMTIILWNLETGAVLDRIDLSSSADWATSLAVSKDGKTLIAGTSRGVVIGFRVK